uniref:Diphthine--ammonia ligase n=1 Tax=Cacopsylla melanoneura TaxID=428564 RepID=A0A8D9A2R8_9HEMI
MKVVALVSGGKDSCYNMLQCIAAGHEIVALANLCPETKEEIDSYMYQSVGYEGIDLYSEAMNLPLFRKSTKGKALNQDKFYVPTSEDEVEDLYELLKQVKDELNIEAVAVGAVLSDYQRVRVENVCSRLGIVALAYLWRRDQEELLQEMIDSNIKAIVVKVAALGLHPHKHLGLTIAEIKSHLVRMR